MCRAISHDEWLCMARVLETIDNEFTGRCRSRAVRYAEVANEQRRRYSNCFDTPRTEVVECGILSTESACLTSACSERAQRAPIVPW